MKNATITFRLGEEEKKTLEEMAARLDVPVSQLIRMFIREGIETMSKEEN
jgi:antitoxin component of RelBE/YafQ-DinJ toxin-antitoxin module